MAKELPNNYLKDIKEEKKDAVKYAVEAKRDPENKGKLKKISKQETGHANALKAIVKKHCEEYDKKDGNKKRTEGTY